MKSRVDFRRLLLEPVCVRVFIPLILGWLAPVGFILVQFVFGSSLFERILDGSNTRLVGRILNGSNGRFVGRILDGRILDGRILDGRILR